jgi:S-adenosylmethionine hydrolase
MTDFGLADPFVGIMHGVVLCRCREARVVDLCHGIEPQSVLEARFWLERSYEWFPPGTIHVAVVDPGVGTDRRALVVEASGHRFVAPDNGLLEGIVTGDDSARVFAVDPARLRLQVTSRTFHGRDVFAPTAAELASGRASAEDVGPVVASMATLDAPVARDVEGGVEGRVVTIDRFGNLITNVEAAQAARLEAPVVVVGNHELPLVGTYGEASPGSLLALVNSFGTVEIAERNGNAGKTLGIGRGATLLVREARRQRT